MRPMIVLVVAALLFSTLLSSALAAPAPAAPSPAIRLGDLDPAPGASSPASILAVSGGRILFATCTAALGCEPWLTDGTPAGTRPVELVPGPDGSGPFAPVLVGTTVYFYSDNPANDSGALLWSIDLADADPRPVKVFEIAIAFPDCCESFVYSLASAGGLLFFNSADKAGDQELWALDTRQEGAAPKKIDVYAGGSSNPSWLTPFGAGVFFSAKTDQGRELAFSDGASVKIFDLNPGSGGSDPQAMARVNGLLYFVASTPAIGTELGLSDGATAELIDLTPGGSSFSYYAPHQNYYRPAFTRVGQATCFISKPEMLGVNWVACTSGHTARRIAERTSEDLHALGDKAVYGVFTQETGGELGITDGTSAQVLDLSPGEASSAPLVLSTAGDRLLLSATTPGRGRELVVSDGTLAGTTFFDLEPGAAGSDPQAASDDERRGFFTVGTSAAGREPAALVGDQLNVLDVNPGPASSSPSFLVPIRGRREMLFWATQVGHGQELWASDGTPEGTRLVQEFGPGEASGLPPLPPLYWPDYASPQVGVGPTAWLLINADDGTGLNPWALGLSGFTGDWRWMPITYR